MMGLRYFVTCILLVITLMAGHVSAQPQAKVELQIMVRALPTVQHGWIEDFQKLYPNIHITILPGNVVPATWWERLILLETTNAGPDVVQVSTDLTYSMINSNLLLPMTPWITNGDLNLSRFNEPAKRLVTINNVLYGMPALKMRFRWQYYFTTVFAEAGLEPPMSLVQRNSWNIFTYKEAARKLTKMDEKGAIKRWGGALAIDLKTTSLWVLRYGGQIFPDNDNTWKFDSQAALDAYSFLQELFVVDRSHPIPGRDSYAFRQEDIGMRVHWEEAIPLSWAGSQWKYGDIEAVPEPGYLRAAGSMDGDFMAIMRSSQHPQEAFLLAHYLSTRGVECEQTGQCVGNNLSSGVAGYIPLQNAWRAKARDQFGIVGFDMFYPQVFSAAYPTPFVLTEENNAANATLTRVLLGNVPIVGELQELNRQLNIIRRQAVK